MKEFTMLLFQELDKQADEYQKLKAGRGVLVAEAQVIQQRIKLIEELLSLDGSPSSC